MLFGGRSFGWGELGSTGTGGERTTKKIEQAAIMAGCLCFGGFCIPYAAAMPLLIYLLQSLAAELAKAGLLPRYVASRIDRVNSGGASKTPRSRGRGQRERTKGAESDRTATQVSEEDCDDWCCRLTSFLPPFLLSAASSVSSETSLDESDVEEEPKDGIVELASDAAAFNPFVLDPTCRDSMHQITSLEQWKELRSKCRRRKLIAKFTAEWSKPCHIMQPPYEYIASVNSKDCVFATIDVDGKGCDAISGNNKVGLLPTFICFDGDGEEVDRISGANSSHKLRLWIEKMGRI